MSRGLVQRIYVRALRQIGLKRLSWDTEFSASVARYGPRSENTLRHVQALCRGGRLLEFGCGEGELPLALPPGTFSSYAGFDISAVAIDRARQRARTQAPRRIVFEQADMATWPGGDRASLILAEECLYYLSPHEARSFLSRCLASLDPDGAMLVIVHSASKHAATLDLCRRASPVHDETSVGGRVFMTLRPSADLSTLPILHQPMETP